MADSTFGNESRATVGNSVSIKGEISGQEDILIEGSVEGVIKLEKNIVTVAKTGKVKAHVYGQVIHVEGEINGDLFGGEQIVVHKTGRVYGNITAPRISLEDGARVKGSIDTEVAGANTSFKDALTVEKSSEKPSVDAAIPLSTSKKNGQGLYTSESKS